MKRACLVFLLAGCNTANFGGGQSNSGKNTSRNVFKNGVDQAGDAKAQSTVDQNGSGNHNQNETLNTNFNPNGGVPGSGGGTGTGASGALGASGGGLSTYTPSTVAGPGSLGLASDNYCGNGDVKDNNMVDACLSLDPGMPAVAKYYTYTPGSIGTFAGSVPLTSPNSAFLTGLINSQATLPVPAGLPNGQYVVYLCKDSSCQPAMTWESAATASGQPANGCGRSGGIDIYTPTDQCKEHILMEALKSANGAFALTNGPVTVSNGAISGAAPTMEVLFCSVNMDSPFGALFTIQNPMPQSPVFTSVPFNSGQFPGCTQSDDPLVIDFSPGSVEISSIAGGVRFDMQAKGKLEQTAWPLPGNNGFLVLPADGKVKDGQQLFGNYTKVNGALAADGFAALAAFDDNKDGVIDAKDAVFGKLAVWFDKNHDGKTDAGEVVSLAELRVKAISLDTTGSQFWADTNGNYTRKQAGVIMEDGSTNTVFDLWFAAIAP